jgi:hypothetical protein
MSRRVVGIGLVNGKGIAEKIEKRRIASEREREERAKRKVLRGYTL